MSSAGHQNASHWRCLKIFVHWQNPANWLICLNLSSESHLYPRPNSWTICTTQFPYISLTQSRIGPATSSYLYASYRSNGKCSMVWKPFWLPHSSPIIPFGFSNSHLLLVVTCHAQQGGSGLPHLKHISIAGDQPLQHSLSSDWWNQQISKIKKSETGCPEFQKPIRNELDVLDLPQNGHYITSIVHCFGHSCHSKCQDLEPAHNALPWDLNATRLRT